MIPGPPGKAAADERDLSSWEARVRDLASKFLSCRRASLARRGRRGFSLAEVLITVLVTAVIMGAVITVLSLFFSNFQFVSSRVSARQRAEMVLSVLAKPIQHAGLGMPVTSEDFQAAFDQVYTPEFTPQDYPSALYVTGSGELRLAFGEPTGLSVLLPEDIQAGSGSTIQVRLNGAPEGIVPGDWVVFPTGVSPLIVRSVSGNDMTLENRGGPTGISRLDELHKVRFFRAYCENGLFHALDPRPGGGGGVTVEGVEGLSVDFDEETRVVSITITGRGKEGSREDFEIIEASWRVKNL